MTVRGTIVFPGLRVLRAAWAGRGVYGWQDWWCPVDRAAMVRDWELKQGRR